MAILTTADKEKIKRAVPKANNKVIDATVARLYIAYPDPTSWQYTGLVGAILLVDDLVGHTFFLKLVDIVGNRGVLWDQELYVNFEYNQDRKFFHTFEIEDCLVGLLFEDTNDAVHFHKRVSTRVKHALKQTANNKNAIALKKRSGPVEVKPGPRGEFVDANTAQRSRRTKGVLYYDDVPPPEWRSLYAELESAGISEDMIADNRQFIKDYIAQQGGPLVGLEPPVPRRYQKKIEPVVESTPTATKSSSHKFSRIASGVSSLKNNKAPPPPPPPAAASAAEEYLPAPESSPSPTPEPATEAAKPNSHRLPPIQTNNAPLRVAHTELSPDTESQSESASATPVSATPQSLSLIHI